MTADRNLAESVPSSIATTFADRACDQVGKGTLIKNLMDGPDGAIFGFSTSHTTRQPRPGEVHGQHYFFVSREDFLADVEAGKFLEHASVHNNLYGTSKMAVNRVLDGGKVRTLNQGLSQGLSP